MIDKKRFLAFNRITLLILLIIVIIMIITISFSSYETTANGEVVNDIAFYVLDTTKETENIKIGDILPDGKDYIYHISVQNYRDNQVSEVDLEYNITLVTTTNIPIEYKIYEQGMDNNLLSVKEVFTDSDGMYFNRYKTGAYHFTRETKMIDNYELVLNFPKEFSDEEYQGLIDSIEIIIESTQI